MSNALETPADRDNWPAVPAGGELSPQVAKIGLWVLIAVIAVLFMQFIHAYVARMALNDWHQMPEVWPLRSNVLVLVASSVAMQWALMSARRDQPGRAAMALWVGGALAVLFLAGQLLAWQALTAQQFGVAGNPANSFFYLISGLHGLHLVGGLVAWARGMGKLWRGVAMDRVVLSLTLCARYWHFLLLIWLVLYGLMFLVPVATVRAICGF